METCSRQLLLLIYDLIGARETGEMEGAKGRALFHLENFSSGYGILASQVTI